MTPSFMRSEPCAIDYGPLAGVRVFTDETRAGLDMVRSLHGDQTARTVLMPSIDPDDLPEESRLGFGEGYTKGGAAQDNARIDFEGISAADFSDAQRRLLESLIGTYVGWSRDGHAGVRMAEVQQHFDETWFTWLGNTHDEGPFYYRVQSPVVLIEFEHQPGIVFDNKAPTAHHVHTAWCARRTAAITVSTYCASTTNDTTIRTVIMRRVGIEVWGAGTDTRKR